MNLACDVALVGAWLFLFGAITWALLATLGDSRKGR